MTVKLTQQQARELCEAHEVESLIANDEERELLELNNPRLLRAYEALLAIAAGSK